MKQPIPTRTAGTLEVAGGQPSDKAVSLSSPPPRSSSLAASSSEQNRDPVNFLIYHVARALIAGLQALPLSIVARLGRAGGALAYWLDARHRRVALQNLQRCFTAEKTPAEIRALARENFRRIGENYASAANTAAMSAEEIKRVLEVAGTEKICPPASRPTPATRVVAIGHFGNFELFARLDVFAPGIKMATTYRGLRQPAFNRLLQSLRAHSGCQFFERRTDSDALKEAMNQPGLILGLLADQHAGRRAPRLPFFGHECATSIAPAIFALRYNCPLHTGICYRTGLGRWRLEFSDEIPLRENGQPRSPEAIARDMNRAFEIAIRRDPANWFWVHNRWKPPEKRSA